MAWTPISNTVPQYSKDAAGTSASSYYLKFYADGTTTPISMATDSTGGTTLAKCQLNTLGYPINGSGDVFIPHIDQTYKLALYTNATDADNDTTANATWIIDNLEQQIVTSSNELVKHFATMALAVADTDLNVGDVLLIKDRANSHWDVVLASGVTPNTYNIVQCTGVGTLALVLRVDGVVNVKACGAKGDYSVSGPDDSAAFLAAYDAVKRTPAAYKALQAKIYLPAGDYYLASGALLDDGTDNSGTITLFGDGEGETNVIVGTDQVGIDFDCGAPIAYDLTVWSKNTWDATAANAGALTISRDTSGIGVRSLQGGRPRFYRMTVYGFGDTGIYSTRMTKGLIDTCRVSGCGTGIDVPTPSTTSTTSDIRNNYVSSCDLGINLNKWTHSTYYNNVIESCTDGLISTLCTNSVFERLYFENNSNQHYKFVNTRGVIIDVSEVDGVGGPPAIASERTWTTAVSVADMYANEVNNDGIASNNLGILSYDGGAGADKEFIKNTFRPTLSNRVRGLRINNRETKSGAINSIGTFPLVNGAKSAHVSTLHIKADGTVITNDDMVNAVVKTGTGQYEIQLNTQTYPDWAHATAYQSYVLGSTPIRHAQIAYNDGSGLNDFTDYDGGNIISRLYVIVTDGGGTLADSGFTLSVGWNMNDDLLS